MNKNWQKFYVLAAYFALMIALNFRFVSMIYLIPAAAVLILFDYAANRKKFRGVFKADFALKDVFYAFALTFPFAFVARLIIPEADFLYERMINSGIVNIAYSVFIAALFFELVHRILLQNKLTYIYNRSAAFFVSAFAFTFVDMDLIFSKNMLFAAVFVIAVIGYSLLASLLFQRHGFMPVMVYHLILNYLLVVQIFLHIKGFDLEAIFWAVWFLLFLATYKRWLNLVKDIMKNAREARFDLFAVLISVTPIIAFFITKFL